VLCVVCVGHCYVWCVGHRHKAYVVCFSGIGMCGVLDIDTNVWCVGSCYELDIDTRRVSFMCGVLDVAVYVWYVGNCYVLDIDTRREGAMCGVSLGSSVPYVAYVCRCRVPVCMSSVSVSIYVCVVVCVCVCAPQRDPAAVQLKRQFQSTVGRAQRKRVCIYVRCMCMFETHTHVRHKGGQLTHELSRIRVKLSRMQGKPVQRFKGHHNTTKNFIRSAFGPSQSLVVGGSQVCSAIFMLLILIIRIVFCFNYLRDMSVCS
jgi:hypothetical protein